MRLEGFEPPRPFEQYDLNVSCLPVPPQPRGAPKVPAGGMLKPIPMIEHMFVMLGRTSDGSGAGGQPVALVANPAPEPSPLGSVGASRRYRLGD